jgi:hypothetical protein
MIYLIRVLRASRPAAGVDARPTKGVVLLAFQAGDAMFVNLGYMHQPGDSFHDLAKAPIALLVFGCGLPVLDCQQLDRLRQSFVAFFELFEGHIN